MLTKLNIPLKTIIVTIACLLGITGSMMAQTAPNTQIFNQAKAVYKFKTYPADTIQSAPVMFNVLDAPNFELSFSNPDSFVFSKETVTVRLVYKNIGNKTADTATVEGILPPAGMKFVPNSTLGVISGSTVTWKIFNVPSGKSDSVKVNVVIDSNLVSNTQMEMQADLNWQSSSVGAVKTFVVSNFPRLSLTVTSLADVVGSGRSLGYRITVKNTGNIPSLTTVVYDTISSVGTFVTGNITPDSISSDKRLIKWNIGTIPAFSATMITFKVQTPPNLATVDLRNGARTFSSNVAAGDKAFVINKIIPIKPHSISVAPIPEFIFGQLNKDSSRIEVVLKDSAGEVLPDGVPVQFSSTVGTFSNDQNTISTSVQDGKGVAYLRAINVSNEIVHSTVTATGGGTFSGTIQDTASVYMFPGAVTGAVLNGINRVPFKGAIARVYNSLKNIIGADTTKEDGRFFIALNKDFAKYSLEILVIDKFGDSIKTVTDIDPSKFPLPPIVIPNIISGRIEYKTTGNPVPAAGVSIFLDSLSSGPAPSLKKNSSIRTLARQTVLTRVQEQKTDVNGKFKFENLTPARYVISLDSVEFPTFSGFTFLADTASGTFTINLSLQIVTDSSVSLTALTPSTVNAGDTVAVGIGIENTGNAEHYSVVLSDTLSSNVKFISATQGNFKSVSYDSTLRKILWQRDTLKTLTKDSVVVKYLVSGNIQDSSKITNRIWLNSNVLSTGITKITTIRSFPLLQFENRFLLSKDTITAGDSIRHVFKIRNAGTDSLRGIRIVDTLFSAGVSGVSLAKISNDSTKIADSVSTVYISSIAPGQQDSVVLKLVTDFSLRKGASIVSHAYVMKGNIVLARRDTILIVNENPNIASFLGISKTANKKVAEIGDIVTYQIQISNTSPQLIRNIGVYDLLPYAFQYIKNSARFNGKAIEPAADPVLNQLKWNFPDTIQSTKTGLLVYQLAIGADAMESEGLNTAYASATAGSGAVLVSTASQWQVTVRPGVFTEKGLIIGKVFYDDNRNTFQDTGENGVKDVELWMEDGTKIITGNDGKFSLPEVKPGQHVMRVNELTIPKNAELLAGNNSFAKDPSSRFVRVTEGGIAKANFYLKRSTGDSLKQSVSKMSRLTSVRQAKPKYLYEDTLRRIKMDTVEMFLSFTYSGSKSLETIDIFDVLPERLALVPNSAAFNGRRINPVISGNTIQWRLGKSREVIDGVLRYKVTIKNFPKNRTLLQSFSTIRTVSLDSVIVENGKMFVENIVFDTTKNRIETSEILTKTVPAISERQMSDRAAVTVGDEIFFKTSLFIDPKKKIKNVRLLDSLEASFIINDRSYTLNGIPVPSKNLSIKVQSSALTSAAAFGRNEVEFLRIASVNLTELLKTGINEITYSAKLLKALKDTVYRKTSYAVIKNDFGEETVLRANEVTITVKAGPKFQSLALETLYVDIPRPSIKVEEKIAEAVKLVESLKQNSNKAVVMDGIVFELSKATLTKESKVVLDNIASILAANTDINLQINGYTDNTGNAGANRTMSLNRAREVAQYLISKGIDTKRLLPQGFGPNNPIASNKTEEGRAKNRRVEFARMK